MRGTDTDVFSYVISKTESLESLIMKIFVLTSISDSSNSNIAFRRTEFLTFSNVPCLTLRNFLPYWVLWKSRHLTLYWLAEWRYCWLHWK